MEKGMGQAGKTKMSPNVSILSKHVGFDVCNALPPNCHHFRNST